MDAFDEERLPEARYELQKLINEEELRNAVLVAIFNMKPRGDDKDDLTEEQEREKKEVLEQRIGFDFIHTGTIKNSYIFDASRNDKKAKVYNLIYDRKFEKR